ncbi:putative integral membrane protein [Brugia pahangi]
MATPFSSAAITAPLITVLYHCTFIAVPLITVPLITAPLITVPLITVFLSLYLLSLHSYHCTLSLHPYHCTYHCTLSLYSYHCTFLSLYLITALYHCNLSLHLLSLHPNHCTYHCTSYHCTSYHCTFITVPLSPYLLVPHLGTVPLVTAFFVPYLLVRLWYRTLNIAFIQYFHHRTFWYRNRGLLVPYEMHLLLPHS